MWQHLLYYAIYKATIEDLRAYFSKFSTFNFDYLLRKEGFSPKKKKVALIKELKYLINFRFPYNKRTEFVQNLAERLNITNEEQIARSIYLSKEHINEMKIHKIDFGAHTKTHPLLSTISTKEAREEVVCSKHAIEDLIGKEVSVFAYPFGEDCLNTQIKQILEEAGFLCACTSIFGINSLNSDFFSLKRKGRSYANITVFAAEIFGVNDLFRKL